MSEDARAFMLDSLRDLQDTLLLLMERANQANIPEAALLEWALTDVITAYRDYREGRIGWWDAARTYQVASNVQLEVDRAILFPIMDIEELKRRGFHQRQSEVSP